MSWKKMKKDMQASHQNKIEQWWKEAPPASEYGICN